jgi:sugar-specific transcriptional regulator TrmB
LADASPPASSVQMCKRELKDFATEQRGGPKRYGAMSLEVLEQRREEMLHEEAELNRRRKALRAERKRSATSRWATAVAWELARAVGLLRKFFRTLKNSN